MVHADETSWSINSAWAFLSEKARVGLFGMHKDSATLHLILGSAAFSGILVSDDDAMHAGKTGEEWRRRESNPRPETFPRPLLRA